ncbi:50S ribosomal protein L21e [Candidatus Woesearchaeota archaeon]|nr:50S ribosomal protein L21e [Candidatus Woesearchaeota archaeon]
MTKRIGGFRRKTRDKFSKPFRRKGKISLSRYFQTFQPGDKVYLIAEPSVQNGMYFPRFHGKTGEIRKKRGSCYEIQINDFTLKKTVIVHPVHLRKV